MEETFDTNGHFHDTAVTGQLKGAWLSVIKGKRGLN